MSLYGGIGSNFAFLKETGSVKKERKMTIELIFKIAAVGILVTILGQVLKHFLFLWQVFLLCFPGLFPASVNFLQRYTAFFNYRRG